MNRHVNAIAGRLSLRAPQRQALEILDRVTEIAPPKRNADIVAALDAIRSEFPSVTDFEREFPSVCFALATGVGKTRLMGAFISYLHLVHGLKNFFVLAPNLTIYDKLITDFTPNTAKYVFQGIADFATDPPRVITGENYESVLAAPGTQLFGSVAVSIFNISKINTEVRGGKSPRIKRLSEYIGESYFDYLAGLPDLVLIMDESHRYRASAGVRAINELKPVLGLELTATPFVDAGKDQVPFKNVILDYPLGRAMEDGFVKEPAVVTRKDFDPSGMTPGEVERIKLEDGVRLHEAVKVELETYARSTDNRIVKPFLLVIARDTTHAGELMNVLKSDEFFDGRYADKVIQVDSSQTGAEKDEVVERLLRVEHTDEPTEIVVHVNMLKEGWDVTNLYTIVPLRAANARTLIEQSIGRGLRLPYGRRTKVEAVDTLSIVAHDRFQEIVDEAKRPDSTIRLKQVVLDSTQLASRPTTVVVEPMLHRVLGVSEAPALSGVGTDATRESADHPTREVTEATLAAIGRLESRPGTVPTTRYLQEAEVRRLIVQEVERAVCPTQLGIEGMDTRPDIAAIVDRTAVEYERNTIDIPRIVVVPTGEVRSGFKPFALDLSNVKYPPVSEDLWVQHLRTGDRRVVSIGCGGFEERRPEDYVVGGLVDFDDIAYDDNSELLYSLAGQVVEHLGSYLSGDQVGKVLRCYQRDIARLVHAQMQEHRWEEAAAYEATVTRGFTHLRPCAFSTDASEQALEFKDPPPSRRDIGRYLFKGFARCLYPLQKFHSDAERVMAIVLDRSVQKWIRPAQGQFQIHYRLGADSPEYVPDFVAEAEDAIYLIEVKARSEISSAEVIAKRDAAVEWCRHASEYSTKHAGKPWKYALIPHDVIAENMTLKGLFARGD